ncbi:hypothetical protein Pelsub_P2569 [Pelolinea submarina]|nr:hypothetical protein Pelsub_P2569 [Pelolinea submarina]
MVSKLISFDIFSPFSIMIVKSRFNILTYIAQKCRKNNGNTPGFDLYCAAAFTRHFVFGREMQKITLWDKIRNPVFKG